MGLITGMYGGAEQEWITAGSSVREVPIYEGREGLQHLCGPVDVPIQHLLHIM
jgi:hypothetical protein